MWKYIDSNTEEINEDPYINDQERAEVRSAIIRYLVIL